MSNKIIEKNIFSALFTQLKIQPMTYIHLFGNLLLRISEQYLFEFIDDIYFILLVFFFLTIFYIV